MSLAELGITYLRERGITDPTIQQYGIEIDSEPTSERFQGRSGFDAFKEGKLADLAKEVIWFPCRDATGKPVNWIARPLPAIGEAKFLNPKGGACPFIPPETWEAKDKTHKPVIITEGPVKALALIQAGGLPIGVGGAWMAINKGENGSIALVPALTQFKWSGRIVYLALDADSATNPSVKQALFRTFLTLNKQGAKVRFLKWPLSEGKGIDDYLHSKHRAGEEPGSVLAKLVNAAHDVTSILDAEDLHLVEGELKVANLAKSQLSQLTQIVARKLSVRASALEESVLGEGRSLDGRAFDLPDPEPWPHLVDGVELLGELIELLRRHVVMTENQAVADALWVMLTYVEAHVDTLPILAITSPQKRCGKTTLLHLLDKLARKPLSASNVTAAALFRSIEKWTPTLLIDEADTFLKEDVELRGVLNSGHARSMAYVLRVNPETLDPERFSTWAPKAIACIGKLPETLADRSIEIRLQRKTNSEETVPFRDTPPETFERLRRQLMKWALDNGERIRAALPPIPGVLNDRAADNWGPLLAIAMILGSDWLGCATKAATTLGADDGDEESVTIKLLIAVLASFKPGVDFMATAEIVEALNQDKEAPWAEWKNGMTPERLGRTLRAFNVKSEQLQKDGKRHRGYFHQALQDLNRYLSPPPSLPPPETRAPVHSSANQVSEPLQPCTGSINEPVQGQIQETNPCTANQVSEPIGAQVHGCTGLNGGIEKGSLNSHPLVQSAVQIFKGEIVTHDELELELACEPEPEPTVNPAPKAKPNPRPPYSALENRLISVLAPHDYDGGLSYGEWRRLSRISDEVFDQTLKGLCRRGGPVYRSARNGRYQLCPRFGQILARQKMNENGKPR